MKQPRKPTRREKELIQLAELNWREWSVETESDTWFVIVNKANPDNKKVIQYR